MYSRVYCKECEKAIKGNDAYAIGLLFTFETGFMQLLTHREATIQKCIAVNIIIIPDVPKVMTVFRLKENINCVHLLIFNNYRGLIYLGCIIQLEPHIQLCNIRLLCKM